MVSVDPGPDGGWLERSGSVQSLELTSQSRHVVTPELGLLCRPIELGEVVK